MPCSAFNAHTRLIYKGALKHAILPLLPILRIHHLRADPSDLSKLPGKRADPVGRSVYDNADDVHMFLFIWKSHSSDNIGAVIVKDLVDLPHSLFIFYNDSHYCDSCFLFHNLLLIYKCRVSVPNSQLGLNPLIV